MADGYNFETLTMQEYNKMPDFDITFGIVSTNFGCCLIGTHDSKICYVSLFDEGKDNSAIDILAKEWPKARLKEDAKEVEELAKAIFEDGEPDRPLDVLLRGTEMQCKVWKELTKVKKGTTAHYEQIAKAIGRPRAVRAVATAIRTNRIAVVVPCHRVVQKAGEGKYRWGMARKRRLLQWEAKKKDKKE